MNYRLLFMLIISICVKNCCSFKILCLLPYTGKSHFMVFEPLINELIARGHELTVVSFFPADIPVPNKRDVSLVGLAPLNVEVLNITDSDQSYYGFEKYLEHIPIVTQLAKSNLQLCEKLLDADILKEFVNAEGDYDLIMVEHFNSDCMLGIVHNYNLPSVGLMSCALLPFSYNRVGAPENPSYVPGMTLLFTDEMTFLERVENTIVHYFYIVWFEIVIRWREQEIWEKKMGRKLPPLEDIGKEASVVLVNTHHSLNGVRVVPPSVVEMGGIHLHNKVVQPLPATIERLVSEAKDGFILFSFGSLIKGHTLPVKRKQAILKVLSEISQHVFWKWEEDMIENLPKNVHTIKWLPQFDLLNHPRCVGFISHAGLLSMTEAVAAGVPLLAIPLLGDQYGNAAHAQRVGLARVLPLRDLDETTFRNELRTVLSVEMRDRVKKLSAMWKDNLIPPMERAIFHIERTARHKGLAMSTAGRHLNRFQLALLDIAAFLSFIVATLIVGLKCTLLLLKNYIGKKT